MFEFALSAFNGTIELGLEGESTGQSSTVSRRLKVPSRDIADFFTELKVSPKLVEMNIEGGEYDCLSKLIETNLIEKVQILLVQFHKYSLEDELRKAEIRLALNKTHNCIFEFPWVWERWDLKE